MDDIGSRVHILTDEDFPIGRFFFLCMGQGIDEGR